MVKHSHLLQRRSRSPAVKAISRPARDRAKPIADWPRSARAAKRDRQNLAAFLAEPNSLYFATASPTPALISSIAAGPKASFRVLDRTRWHPPILPRHGNYIYQQFVRKIPGLHLRDGLVHRRRVEDLGEARVVNGTTPTPSCNALDAAGLQRAAPEQVISVSDFDGGIPTARSIFRQKIDSADVSAAISSRDATHRGNWRRSWPHLKGRPAS